MGFPTPHTYPVSSVSFRKDTDFRFVNVVLLLHLTEYWAAQFICAHLVRLALFTTALSYPVYVEEGGLPNVYFTYIKRREFSTLN